jgi:predicted GIY-YIG superfamily endonuclease
MTTDLKQRFQEHNQGKSSHYHKVQAMEANQLHRVH